MQQNCSHIDIGAYGYVYKVQRVSDQKLLALKLMNLQLDNFPAKNAVISEISTLVTNYLNMINQKKICPHPNIVNMIDHLDAKKDSQTNIIYILLEYCPGGNLFNLIEERSKIGLNGLNEIEILDIMSDLVNGVIHLHLYLKMYLKEVMENGKYAILEVQQQTLIMLSTTIAPEQLDLYSGYAIDEKVDIWAMGNIIYTLMFFKSPFQPGEKLAQINAVFKFPTDTYFSQDLQNLIKQTLSKDPKKRIGIGELWSCVDLIKEKLLKQPTGIPLVVGSAVQPAVVKPIQNESARQVEVQARQRNIPKQHRIESSSKLQSQDKDKSINIDQTFNMKDMVQKMINPQESAVNEKDMRILIEHLHQKNDQENTFYRFLAVSDYKSITVVVLKATIVTHRLQLYCPFITQKSLISLYQKIIQSWQGILQSKVKNVNDKFRCEYFAKLILQYADYQCTKSQIVSDYSDLIDGSFSLIKYFNKSNDARSPLNIDFITRLDKLWTKMNNLCNKLVKDQRFLWELRLNIITNLIEDQYLLLCLISHLIVSIKIVCQRFNQQVPQNFVTFIDQAQKNYDQNLEQLKRFYQKLSNFQELAHLNEKIPKIPNNLSQDVKNSTRNSKFEADQRRNHFILTDLLNTSTSINGLQIPLPFQLYKEYTKNSHDFYELLIGTQKYRNNIEKFQQFNSKSSNIQVNNNIIGGKQQYHSNRSSFIRRTSSANNQGDRSSKTSQNMNMLNNDKHGPFHEANWNSRQDSQGFKLDNDLLSDQTISYLQQNIFGQFNSQNQGDELLEFAQIPDKQNELIQQLNSLNINQEQQNFDSNQFDMNWAQQVKPNQSKNTILSQNRSQQRDNESWAIIGNQKVAQESKLKALNYQSPSNNQEFFQIQNQNQSPQKQQFNFQNQNLPSSLSNFQSNSRQQQQQIFAYQYNSPQQSSTLYYNEDNYNQMIQEQQNIEKQYQDLRIQQTADLKRQQDLIAKMKNDQEKGDKIQQQEHQLLQMKQSFSNEKKKLLNQRNQLEKELLNFQKERQQYESQKKQDMEKLSEAKLQILQEKRQIEAMKKKFEEDSQQQQKKLFQMQQQQTEQDIQNQMKQNQLIQEMQKLQEEKTILKAQLQEEQKLTNSIGKKQKLSNATDQNNANNPAGLILEEEFQKGQEYFMLKLADLKVEKQIGAGASAEVFKGTYKETDVAIKKLRNMMASNDNTLKEFKREVSTLTRVRHPNLVLFMGARDLKSLKYTIYLQQLQCSLLLTQPIERETDYVQVKITDFGLSRDDHSELMTGQAGTFHWMAPETLENKPYTHKADVYSFGIVLWEIICREPPFKSYNAHEIIYKVINYKERPSTSQIPKDCPRELINVMIKCWDQNPQNRPDFSDIVKELKKFQISN
ncbi:protein kinase domain containing protein [Stylonychia lemnae]|uniref:non-specific serine/threonine protein kinase n=1 Tax=Stylonychia lemnae TaxID=5949 RepID=A0A078AGG6_STYLE|nr:protein kinase domain containing protein [Stylonychia lemnae]|eukprot:CDW80632.1 protein kinase domain containing protein [Stylonychia lemnae]